MIINSIDYIRQIIPLNTTFNFSKLQPFIQDAEYLLKDLIGSEFYNELDAYNNTDPKVEVAEQEAAIGRINQAVALLSFHFGFEMLNTNFGNEGFRRLVDEDNGALSLFARQEENLKENFKKQGYNKLDSLLEFLEDNKIDYPTWVASDAYTNRLINYINTTRKFDSLYNIESNRLIFTRLRPMQTIVEDFDIMPLIGTELHEQLKTEIATEALTEANSKLVTLIQKAAAPLSIYRGGVDLAMQFTEYGWMQSSIVTTSTNVKERRNIDKDALMMLVDKAGDIGKSYLKSIESFLKKSIDDYPLFEASDAYQEVGSAFDLDNTGKKIITM